MGATISLADSQPPMPDFLSPAAKAAVAPPPEKEPVAYTNYYDLPPPVKYEDLTREIGMALKPDTFEGFRFEVNRPLNQNFFLSHSIFMGNIDLPMAGSKQTLKCPVGTYEFGANVLKERFFMLGRITSDARLSGRVKLDVNDWLTLKGQCQLSNDQGQSQVMVDADVKGTDWNAQLKVGSPQFYGLNYFQSVTPALSAGGEFFYLPSSFKSGVGVALRHNTDTHIATLQAATTGIVCLQYAHKVSEKVTLASDFLWHWASREVTASVGYDCMLRQCRLRGKADTNGVLSAYLEERFTPGINFLLSAELDHWHKNYKFGFGVTAGE